MCINALAPLSGLHCYQHRCDNGTEYRWGFQAQPFRNPWKPQTPSRFNEVLFIFTIIVFAGMDCPLFSYIVDQRDRQFY